MVTSTLQVSLEFQNVIQDYSAQPIITVYNTRFWMQAHSQSTAVHVLKNSITINFNQFNAILLATCKTILKSQTSLFQIYCSDQILWNVLYENQIIYKHRHFIRVVRTSWICCSEQLIMLELSAVVVQIWWMQTCNMFCHKLNCCCESFKWSQKFGSWYDISLMTFVWHCINQWFYNDDGSEIFIHIIRRLSSVNN